MNEEALAQELMATYRAEARERLEAITRVLLEIERDPSGSERAQQVEHVFREVHSLKGAARSVSESAVERVAHAFECAVVAGGAPHILQRMRSWRRKSDRASKPCHSTTGTGTLTSWVP